MTPDEFEKWWFDTAWEVPDIVKGQRPGPVRTASEMFGNFPLSTAAESEPQDEVKPEELVRWFVEHGWRSSWQDVVARFLKTYKVVQRA